MALPILLVVVIALLVGGCDSVKAHGSQSSSKDGWEVLWGTAARDGYVVLQVVDRRATSRGPRSAADIWRRRYRGLHGKCPTIDGAPGKRRLDSKPCRKALRAINERGVAIALMTMVGGKQPRTLWVGSGTGVALSIQACHGMTCTDRECDIGRLGRRSEPSVEQLIRRHCGVFIGPRRAMTVVDVPTVTLE
jgi:hypothetical protein